MKLTKALKEIDDVFERGRRVCDEWKGPSTSVPTSNITYQEACHIVQRREDEKRKRESKNESKNKNKAGQEQLHLPGSQPGVDPDVSAFWMVMEVRSLGCQTSVTAIFTVSCASLALDAAVETFLYEVVNIGITMAIHLLATEGADQWCEFRNHLEHHVV
jgi:hypothetical protein